MEYILSDYLNRYLVFEVDFLTDDVKHMIDVDENDCYMMCYGFINHDGLFRFICLSVGPSLEECVKGLDVMEPLKLYTIEDLLPYEFEEVEPDEDAEIKCNAYLDKHEPFWSKEVSQLRRFALFDGHRDPNYPDLIEAECIGVGNVGSIIVRPTKLLLYGICQGVVADSKNSNIVQDGDQIKLFSGIFDGKPVVVAIKESQINQTIGKMDSNMPADFDWEKIGDSVKAEIEEMFEDIAANFFNNGNLKC